MAVWGNPQSATMGRGNLLKLGHLNNHVGQQWQGKFMGKTTLQRKNAENWKQIFPEKEYRGLIPNFHNHVSVSELYIPTMELPFLLGEICGPIMGIYKSLTDT
jgi:hypothetical protein